jgi:hypothetical protein
LINKARREKATLIASGLLAGGAIFGVISAILKYAGAEATMPECYVNSMAFNVLSVVMFVGLCTYLILHSRTKK